MSALLLSTITFHPDTGLIAVLVGIVLPLVTGAVTKLEADSAVKAVTNSVLVVVTGILVSLAAEPEKGLALYDTLYAIGLAAVSSWGTYARIWRPLHVTDAVQQSTSTFGIGTPKVA